MIRVDLATLNDEQLAAHTVELDALDAADQSRWAAPDIMLQSALWYAARGWPVFPCKPGLKVPATRNGFKDATCDPAVIQAWWRDVPTRNIGIPTGINFDAIDIDTPAGYQQFATLRESGAVPPILGTVATPRGGRHILIAPTGDGNAAAFLDGIDYRGLGGYVIAPPSVDENGRRYVWLQVPV